MTLFSLHWQGFLPFWDELYPLHGKLRVGPRYRDVLKQHLKGARVPYVSWSAWQCPGSRTNGNCWWPCLLAAQLPSGFLLESTLQPPGPQHERFPCGQRSTENGNTCYQTLLTFWKCRQAIPSSIHRYHQGREDACGPSILPPGNYFFSQYCIHSLKITNTLVLLWLRQNRCCC